MIYRIITFSVIVILSLHATPALPQSDPYNGYSVQHFTDENGLPQNSINDLLFDKNGFLWLGTQVGLMRFNGSSFQLYYPDDKPAMESDVVSLGKDGNGDIYFRTEDYNLYWYPGNNNHLLAPVNTTTQKRPFLLNSRKQFFNLTHFLNNAPPNEKDQRARIFQYLFSHYDNFYAVDSVDFYFSFYDTLYFSDERRLTKLDGLPHNALQYLLVDRKLYAVDKDSVIAVYENGRKIGGRAAIGGDLQTDAAGLRRSKSRFQLYPGTKTNHLLAGKKLYRIMQGPKGTLTTSFLIDLDFINNISAVEYNEGLDLLLVATQTEGFYFLRKNRFRINGWSAALRELAAKHLFGPLALRNGKEILTDKFIFEPNGKFIPIRYGVAIWQRCLYIDSSNQVWSAIYEHPRILNAHMEAVRVYPALDAHVIDYTEDGEGRLYCLTEKSLWRLETDTFRKLADIGDRAPGASKNANESFCFVGPHRLWIANVNGLIEYDLQGRTARNIPDMAGKHVRAIHRCKDGSILLGTYGQGYYYYYHERFHPMPLDKSGFLITAHCFLEDRDGNIWIPCNKGLFKVPLADMNAWCAGEASQIYYYYYGRQDGLLTNEFNGGFNSSGIITPEGFVALSSMKGMVCFYTDSLQTAFPQGPIEMTHVEIDGKTIGPPDTIRLPAGYNNLLLAITCPYLGNRKNLYLEYNLQGLNDEWKEVPDDGVINLSRLEPGGYRLRVRKVNGFGKNNYLYGEWSIVATPHFYQTTLFKVAAGLVLLALLIVLIQLRLNLIRKKKEIRIKAERLRDTVVALEDTVRKLQESEKALVITSRQRERLISLVIHDLRSPLRFLTMLAADLHDNQGHFSPVEIKERSYLVKKGAQDIYNFSEDFLLWVTSQKDNFSVSNKLFAIRPLLQEIYDFFRDQVLQKGNSLTYEAGEDLQLNSDPHILIMILRNLTDNANKYTSQGCITIKACSREGDIVISVTDTGRGMSRRQLEDFLRDEDINELSSGSQLGHKFILDLTRRIHGRLSIESSEGEGTKVTLLFTPPSASYTSPE